MGWWGGGVVGWGGFLVITVSHPTSSCVVVEVVVEVGLGCDKTNHILPSSAPTPTKTQLGAELVLVPIPPASGRHPSHPK